MTIFFHCIFSLINTETKINYDKSQEKKNTVTQMQIEKRKAKVI